MDALEPAFAVEATCYCRVRMACYRAAHPVARRQAKTARVAAVQDMYMDIAGRRESKESGTGWMWTRDWARTAPDLGGAWDPWRHRSLRERERGRRDI